MHSAQSLELLPPLCQAADFVAHSIQGIASYRYPFNTWVESGKCRLISCQRTLVPWRDWNRGPCDPLDRQLIHLDLITSNLSFQECHATNDGNIPSPSLLPSTHSNMSSENSSRACSRSGSTDETEETPWVRKKSLPLYSVVCRSDKNPI